MTAQPPSAKKAWLYLSRSLRLRCPECGISPIFMSTYRTESLTDWFAHLPGCPRCGYAYDREPGYFLFALWMVTFTITSGCGLAQVFLLDYLFDFTTPTLLVCTIFPVVVVNVLLVRHIKAAYLALDHFVHPHGDDDSDEIQGTWGSF
jgi:uncharacterized protein (DUF983 family)